VEELVLVDNQDREIGFCDKLEAHKRGLLHRAISVMLLDDKRRFLLQRRAAVKYHSPLLWANSCCSHPGPGESVERAAHRRIQEELGIRCQLWFCSSFIYRAEVSNDLIEHEFDHLFLGTYTGPIYPNPLEVDKATWWTQEEIEEGLLKTPEIFCPWFSLVYKELLKCLSQ
jgi:isopentenyl-diphosphate delta-isomerase